MAKLIKKEDSKNVLNVYTCHTCNNMFTIQKSDIKKCFLTNQLYVTCPNKKKSKCKTNILFKSWEVEIEHDPSYIIDTGRF